MHAGCDSIEMLCGHFPVRHATLIHDKNPEILISLVISSCGPASIVSKTDRSPHDSADRLARHPRSEISAKQPRSAGTDDDVRSERKPSPYP